MIKLKELLDINYPSVDLFSESPLRIGKWDTRQLDSLGGNYAFTVGLKEKAKQIGDFDGYEIYEYEFGGDLIDCFVHGDYTLSFLQFDVLQNNVCNIKRVWQDCISIGLNRKIILEYYLHKYSAVLTGDMHTEFGEKSVKKLLTQALELGCKVFILKDDKERLYINNIDALDQYYSSGSLGLRYKFGIEK